MKKILLLALLLSSSISFAQSVSKSDKSTIVNIVNALNNYYIDDLSFINLNILNRISFNNKDGYVYDEWFKKIKEYNSKKRKKLLTIYIKELNKVVPLLDERRQSLIRVSIEYCISHLTDYSQEAMMLQFIEEGSIYRFRRFDSWGQRPIYRIIAATCDELIFEGDATPEELLSYFKRIKNELRY